MLPDGAGPPLARAALVTERPGGYVPGVPLDLFVMPMSRYLSGDFEYAPRDTDPDADTVPAPKPDATPESAMARVTALQEYFTAELDRNVSWHDEGTVVASLAWDARYLHALRSYAAYGEYPHTFLGFRRGFKVLRDPRDHPSLRRIYEGEETRYPHLMRHSDNRGFFIPVDMEHPLVANENNWWMVGSCHGLRMELETIAAELGGDTLAGARIQPRDPLAAVRRGLADLHRLSSLAIEHELPIVFHG